MSSGDAINFVTGRYPHLQGLRLVPLGFPFLISGAWRSGSGSLAEVPERLGVASRYLFIALLAVALAVSVLAARYYRRQFGNVLPERRAGRVLALALFAASLVAAAWMQDTVGAAVALPTVVIAVALGWLGVTGGHVRAHYLALAALCLVFASLGALGVSVDTRDALLDNLVGVGLIVIGIGDHLLITQIARGSVCHRFHAARQRLARWLLEASDRTQSPRILMTQERLGQALGLQRTGVTAASVALQDAGAIRSRHGRITIADRRRLELAACECYQAARETQPL